MLILIDQPITLNEISDKFDKEYNQFYLIIGRAMIDKSTLQNKFPQLTQEAYNQKFKIHPARNQFGRTSLVQFAETYSGKMVALKFYNKDTIKYYPMLIVREVECLEEYMNEGEDSKICKIIEYFRFTSNHSEQYVLVLEFFECGSLKNLLDEVHLVSSLQKAKYCLNIAHGIQQLHSRNRMHRDLKPENIFGKKIRPNEYEFKLGDFGSSRQNQNDLQKTIFVGSLLYMHPALYQDTNYSFQCDIFSFGITIYQMWTNQYLFPHPNEISTFKRLLFQYLTDLNQNLSKKIDDPAIVSIIQGCLSMKGQFTIDKVVERLQAFIRGFGEENEENEGMIKEKEQQKHLFPPEEIILSKIKMLKQSTKQTSQIETEQTLSNKEIKTPLATENIEETSEEDLAISSSFRSNKIYDLSISSIEINPENSNFWNDTLLSKKSKSDFFYKNFSEQSPPLSSQFKEERILQLMNSHHKKTEELRNDSKQLEYILASIPQKLKLIKQLQNQTHYRIRRYAAVLVGFMYLISKIARILKDETVPQHLIKTFQKVLGNLKTLSMDLFTHFKQKCPSEFHQEKWILTDVQQHRKQEGLRISFHDRLVKLGVNSQKYGKICM